MSSSHSNAELSVQTTTTTSKSASAICIQTWFRQRLYKEWKSYTHPITPQTTINASDFFTFQPIHEIPFYRRFFIQEITPSQTHVFGFDLDSFYQLLHHSPTTDILQPFPQPCLNPYTRNPITEYQIYRFYRTVQLHKLLFSFFPYKIKQTITCLELFKQNQYLLIRYYPRSYDLRLKILMEELSDLEPQWEVVQGIHWWKEITSNPSKNKQFYRILSVLLKRNTYPLFSAVRFPQRETFTENTSLCLDICEYFLLTIEATKEERESTATLILTALTVVSKNVRALFPWLFKNYW